VFGLG